MLKESGRLSKAVVCSRSVVSCCSFSCLPSCELMTMSPLMVMLLLAVTMAPCVLVAGGSGTAAHPAHADAADTCGPADAAEARLEEYGGERVVDITHAYRPELPAPGRDDLGPVTRLTESMANGAMNNVSELRVAVHAGSHVEEHFEAGLDVDKLDLDVLNGRLAKIERVPPSQGQFRVAMAGFCVSVFSYAPWIHSGADSPKPWTGCLASMLALALKNEITVNYTLGVVTCTLF